MSNSKVVKAGQMEASTNAKKLPKKYLTNERIEEFLAYDEASHRVSSSVYGMVMTGGAPLKLIEAECTRTLHNAIFQTTFKSHGTKALIYNPQIRISRDSRGFLIQAFVSVKHKLYQCNYYARQHELSFIETIIKKLAHSLVGTINNDRSDSINIRGKLILDEEIQEKLKNLYLNDKHPVSDGTRVIGVITNVYTTLDAFTPSAIDITLSPLDDDDDGLHSEYRDQVCRLHAEITNLKEKMIVLNKENSGLREKLPLSMSKHHNVDTASWHPFKPTLAIAGPNGISLYTLHAELGKMLVTGVLRLVFIEDPGAPIESVQWSTCGKAVLASTKTEEWATCVDDKATLEEEFEWLAPSDTKSSVEHLQYHIKDRNLIVFNSERAVHLGINT